MVTIHPGLVLGPALTTASKSGSMTTMKAFIDYSLATGAPDLALGMVDVRDVARAHILAGFTPIAHGRYITNARTITMLEIGRILRSTDARDYLIGTGVEVAPGSPGELERFMKSETDKYRRIIQVSGTRLD